MPSFLEQRETLESWTRVPGTERLEAPTDRVALTFDDGPDPEGTPAVLDALDAAGARGTFFLVGEQILRHHDLGGEIARRGHGVALHGFRHVDHSRLDAVEARDDLTRGLDAIEAATGKRPSLFRPPYGRPADSTAQASAELGLRLVYWSAWGADWEPIPAERIAELASRDLLPGAIVLLHDSARYSSRRTALPTAEAVGAIVTAAAERRLGTALLAE